jgi:signal transduction histidine kinase
MESLKATPALGRRFVLLVLCGAVLPLGAIGLWMTRSAARSGRSLLRSQLEVQLAQTARDVEEKWGRYRSDLATLGENEPVRLALLDPASTVRSVPPFVQRTFAQMTEFNRVEIRDRKGRTLFVLGPTEEVLMGPGREVERNRDARGVSVKVPLTDLATEDTIGTIEALLRVAMLVPAATQLANPAGPLTALVAGGRISVPPGADERLFADENFEWGGHRWLAVRQKLADPPLQLAMAGTLDPYVGVFESAARRSATALLLAASIIAAVLVMLTRRMTREVERELAQRDALAAVGEFASELAHEVRNPLTSIRLDLQRVEEGAADSEAVRGTMSRVLHQIDRLDRAVTGALRVARGGTMKPTPVDLREVLESARRAAEPEFSRRGGRVLMAPASGEALNVNGDAGALEQLFLNLLINAAQSLAPNGEAQVGAVRRNGNVEVTIADTGSGMTPAELENVAKPFRSSRRDGTGLGLKIARRIVTSHHGEMEMRSSQDAGTTVVVRLRECHRISGDSRPTVR